MAVYRVDVDGILARMNDAQLSIDDWAFYLMPVLGDEILKDVIGDRLLWRATYEDSAVDWDVIQNYASLTYMGLDNMIKVSELEKTLLDIQNSIIDLQSRYGTILEAVMGDTIVNNYIGSNCGCGESGVVSSGGTSGQEWDSPFDLCLDPIPDGENQEDDGFEDWKCASSNHVVLRLKALVVAIRQLIAIGETGYTAFVEQVNNQFGGSFVVNVSTALFASMLTFVTGILSFEVMNTITDWIDSEYENLVNAINCADSPASAYTSVLSVINGSSLSTPLKYALRYLFLLIPYASVFLPESERSDIPAYDYPCDCGETVYDFDVTVNLMTGEPNVEFLSFFPEARVKLKEWWASMNATDALPNGELGFSRTGLKQIVDAVAGSPVTSATLQLFEWVGEGAIEGVGDWGIGSGATCADGYAHAVVGDNSGTVQSGIILTCPQSLFSHVMNEDIVNGDGQAGIVAIQQNYLNTVATGLSEGHVLSMRFAGSFVV